MQSIKSHACARLRSTLDSFLLSELCVGLYFCPLCWMGALCLTAILAPHWHFQQMKGTLAWTVKFLFLFTKDLFPYFYVHGHFSYMYVCVPCMYLMPVKTRKGCQIPWHLSYRWLGTTMWGVGIEPRPTTRAARALNWWTISPTPSSYSTEHSTFCL